MGITEVEWVRCDGPRARQVTRILYTTSVNQCDLRDATHAHVCTSTGLEGETLKRTDRQYSHKISYLAVDYIL